ncbi:MAG: pyridoxal phosphate-dependent aminotransferase [Elusimicrobiota bacterium]
MELSKIAVSIKPSATLRLNEVANRLKSEGKDIIHLGGGEPEFDIPLKAISRSIEKLNSKRVNYTPTSGIKKLKEKICEYAGALYGIEPDIDNIVVSSGAKQCIYNFLMATVDPGDEVIILAPYWVSYPEMVSMVYGTPVIVKPSNGLIPSWEDIKSHITSNTKAIMINSPNNPSGLVYPDKLMEKILTYCYDNNIYILLDSIYDQLIIDDIKTSSPFSHTGGIIDNVILVNGVSKSFAMTGFRIGYSISSKPVAKAMTKIQAQVTSCPSDLSQVAAIGAIEEGKDFTLKLVNDLRRKRDILCAGLDKIKKAVYIKPQATFYSFVDFSAYEKDSTKLSSTLIEKVGVVTVPGCEFGMEGYLRISFCGADNDIKRGVDRIREFVDGGNL